jgi:hypothetical protein
LIAADLPKAQQNDRSALTLLALGGLTKSTRWKEATMPMLGVTPIMKWAARHFGRSYAPNSRETFRRFTLHQFVEAGLATYNPDKPERPVNSPKAVYQLTAEALALVRTYGSHEWDSALESFLRERPGLAARYAMHRHLKHVPVSIPDGGSIKLSRGSTAS